MQQGKQSQNSHWSQQLSLLSGSGGGGTGSGWMFVVALPTGNRYVSSAGIINDDVDNKLAVTKLQSQQIQYKQNFRI